MRLPWRKPCGIAMGAAAQTLPSKPRTWRSCGRLDARAELLRIARRTMRVVKMNLVFTTLYNLVGCRWRHLVFCRLSWLPPHNRYLSGHPGQFIHGCSPAINLSPLVSLRKPALKWAFFFLPYAAHVLYPQMALGQTRHLALGQLSCGRILVE